MIAAFMVPQQDKRKRSQADKIRSMSDEELAEFIASGFPSDACKNHGDCDDGMPCSECVLEWLKLEVDE